MPFEPVRRRKERIPCDGRWLWCESMTMDRVADLLKWMFCAVFVIGAWVFALIRLLPPVGS